MKGNRRALIFAAAAIVVVLAAVGITGVVLLNRDNANTAAPPPQTSATPTTTLCQQPEKVYVTFDADAEMEQVASVLAGDPRIASTATETRKQAYARAKEVFKDKPDVLEVLHPDAMRPAIHLQPVPSLTAETLADQLRTELPLADEVKLEHGPC